MIKFTAYSMTNVYYVNCSKCGDLKDIETCKKCERGHVLCTSCSTSHYYLLTTNLDKCPLCNTGLLYLATDSVAPVTAFDDLKKEVYKKTWKFTFWWWRYLFRNPEIVLSLVCWPITLLLLLEARRNPSFGATVVEWIEGSLIASIAPIITLVFIQRKRSGLGLINGWVTVWRGDLRPIWLTVGIVAVLFMIHLLMGK